MNRQVRQDFLGGSKQSVVSFRVLSSFLGVLGGSQIRISFRLWAIAV